MTPSFYLWLLKFASSGLFNYVDKNKDGSISKDEIQNIVNILNNLRIKLIKRDKKVVKGVFFNQKVNK